MITADLENLTKYPSTVKWKPRPHTVIKDPGLEKTLSEDGYKVVPFLSELQLNQLKKLYQPNHDLDNSEGGMFYTLYSRDFPYRQMINDNLAEILSPSFDQHFKNFKNVINIFVVKTSGPASEFYTHQDMTGLDENQYSPLSCWIPLTDVDEKNGTLCVVPRSHKFLSPYRGISFPSPFEKIQETVRAYLQPLKLKAGEALIFDPRIIHNSLTNSSGKDRVAIVSGIFPPEAKFISCFKEPREDAFIEFFEQPEDYLLKYPNFYHDCHIRPVSGEVVGYVEDDFNRFSAEEFDKKCLEFGIRKVNSLEYSKNVECQMIFEPTKEAEMLATQACKTETTIAHKGDLPSKTGSKKKKTSADEKVEK